MLIERLIKFLNNVEKTVTFKTSKLRKRYRFLNKADILKGAVFVVFIFLLSGGVTTIFSGSSNIIAQGTMAAQSPTELFIYLFIHLGYAAGLILIYMGIKRSRIDMAYVSLGFALVFSLLMVEWYIMAMVKGVSI